MSEHPAYTPHAHFTFIFTGGVHDGNFWVRDVREGGGKCRTFFFGTAPSNNVRINLFGDNARSRNANGVSSPLLSVSLRFRSVDVIDNATTINISPITGGSRAHSF